MKNIVMGYIENMYLTAKEKGASPLVFKAYCLGYISGINQASPLSEKDGTEILDYLKECLRNLV